MSDYEQVPKEQINSKFSSLIISAFTQDMNDLQQKEIQRKINSLTDGFKNLVSRQTLKKKKFLPEQVDAVQNKYRQGENYRYIDAHRIVLEELMERYQTDIYSGLTEKDARLRALKKKNNIIKITQNSMVKRILKEVFTIFHLMILLASILSFISYKNSGQFQILVTSIVLISFVFISSVISQFKQRKGLNIMENIESIIPKYCVIIRDGLEKKMLTSKLVAGDIIRLSEGLICPADIRILASTELYVNSEMYTGSSKEEYMHPECSNKENPLSTHNMIFLGSKIVRGKGKGVVISTGVDSLIQDLGFKCSQDDYFPDSQLKKDFDQFLSILSGIIMVVSLIILFINLGKDEEFGAQYHLQFMIGMIVSGLPLGIVLMKTVYLLIVQKQLTQDNIEVNYIESISVLGQTTCICTDMTGTLTLNKPIVSDLWYDDRAHVAKNKQVAGAMEKLQYNIETEKTLQELMNCAVLCNESNFTDRLPTSMIKEVCNNKKLSFEEKKQKLERQQQQYAFNLMKKKWIDWPCQGVHQNESALLKFFQPLKDIRQTRKEQPIARDFIRNAAKIPYSSSTKFSCVICSNPKDDSYFTVYTKGAPSVVWSMCDKVMMRGKTEPKYNTWEVKFEKILEVYGEKGERVMAFSKVDLPKDEYTEDFEFNMTNPNFLIKNQVFLGLISQLDPPDYRSANMVKICKQAGIKVIMLTGEESSTACQIAKSCNIITMPTQIELNKEFNVGDQAAFQEAQSLVIDGNEVAKILSREEGLPKKQKGIILKNYLRKPEIIFTKVQPAHKEQIVKTLQRLGYLVTATGLGIRDSPALRQAEVGVSFGIQGEQVAKDTSDMILKNDQFITLVKGIEKGRLTFDNLKKSILFCLSSTVPQLAAFIFFYLSQMPFALTALQVFILDIGLVHLPALLYVFLQPEIPPMERKPEQSHQVNKKIIFSSYFGLGWFSLFAGFLAYFSLLNDSGIHYSDLKGILAKKIFIPYIGDEFDPQSPWLGNTQLKFLYPCNPQENYSSHQKFLDWQCDTHNYFDLRLAFAKCQPDGSWKSDFIQEEINSENYFECQDQNLNRLNTRPNCYTTEVFKQAQTAYLYASSIVMIIQYYTNKTRIQSILTDRLENLAIPSGVFLQIITLLIFTLIDVFNDTLLTRKLDFKYYGWFGIPFGLFLLIFEEGKKKIIRKQMESLKDKVEKPKKKEKGNENEGEKKPLKETEQQSEAKQKDKDEIDDEDLQEKDNLLYRNINYNKQMQNKFKLYMRKNENTWFKRNALI